MNRPTYKGVPYRYRKMLGSMSEEFRSWKAGEHPDPDTLWHGLWDTLLDVCKIAYPEMTIEHVEAVHLHLMGKLHDNDFATGDLSCHVHYFLQWAYVKRIPDIRPTVLCDASPLDGAITPPLEDMYLASLPLAEKVATLIPLNLRPRYYEMVDRWDFTDAARSGRALDRICSIAARRPILGSKILCSLHEIHNDRQTYFPFCKEQ